MQVEEIVSNFRINAPITSILPYGGGHINDTFHIACAANSPDYLLQKVNGYVFKDIEGLMNNIAVVTAHLKSKLTEQGVTDLERRYLDLIKTKQNTNYIEDEDGHFWRVLNFIKDHKVFDSAPNAEIAFEGARMFGKFLQQLADLDPSKVVETIPNFHNIKFRLNNLENVIKEDPVGRVRLVKDEIKYARDSFDIMSVIQNLGESGSIPSRIVHNDTKVNNVLFDQQNKGLCVIDLDTIMPGFAHYDFGDGVRTCANTGKEDDEDLKNVTYNLEMYQAFSAGYIDSVKSILTETERNTLVNAALLFPFIMGVRFLTDFIAGDVYYKTAHESHNLVRARAQLKMAADGEAKFSELERIVKNA